MRNLTLRQLRAVAAVRQTGRIVNAASRLSLSQPAVTLQIREVETALGMPLFDRTADGMRPTAAGEAVAEAAEAIEQRLRALADEIDAIQGIQKGTLRLGIASTAKYFAPAVMAGFMKAHPGLTVSLSVGNRAETIASLVDHSLDFALMGRPPADLPVRAIPFGDHPLVMVAPADHPLVRKRRISRERIARENFLVRETGSGTRLSLEIYLGELRGGVEKLGTEMGSNETIKQAVMAGLGVAFISAHTIAQEVELGRLAVLDVEGTPIWRKWFLVSRADRTLSPPMQAFEAFLLEKGPSYLPRLP